MTTAALSTPHPVQMEGANALPLTIAFKPSHLLSCVSLLAILTLTQSPQLIVISCKELRRNLVSANRKSNNWSLFFIFQNLSRLTI